MARRFQRLGLRGVLFGYFTVAQAVLFLVLAFVVQERVEDFLDKDLSKHGHLKAQQLARSVFSQKMEVRQGEHLQGFFDSLRGDDDVRFAALLDRNGVSVASSGTRPPGVEASVERLLRNRLGTDPELTGDTRLIAEPLDNGAGWVVLAMNPDALTSEVVSLRWTVLAIFGSGLFLVMLFFFPISRVLILHPLEAMMSMARRLAESDLTGRVEVGAVDELGKLAEALNRIALSWRETLGRVRGVSESLAGVIEQISRTGTTVSSGASTVQSRVEETSTSMVEMLASLRGIAENVEVLYQSAEQSSSSIMEMAATNDEVAENVQSMTASVEETTSAIEEMSFSIREVATNISGLSASTEETSVSIKRMDSSIGQVETNANETARLSEQVSEDAQSGVESLQKTLSGIDRIKETSRTAAGVIESLGRRILEIGNILNVIDDVAEQTNLLALNAAIIAAQAGEHGKGFAVVAEEIKDLAERTGASTKEIAELIRSIQEESRNAVSVMNQGVKNVEEGVLLGRDAEGALWKINDSAQKATQMVKAIARATVEQARGSRQVTTAIQRISETVQMISKASNEQAKGSEQIIKSAERMKVITAHVQRSSQEQTQGSKQITRSIESINEMVTHLNRAQKEQTKGSEQVLKAVDTIKTVSEHQTRSVRQLEEAIDHLQKQAEVLRGEVRRFRV
ncbi:methyl-accepting chemotaxis protein [Stigmatella sp. ncwal1]|uniref:Methyl-accepting chemotaxis protein n=1 Tax=Stigmatella ashevillensis TaxID=2995309 RepID=A0ABT5D892_9BACT|nr:methyl-accepting chemotaxis protein [Stigmatella ashevillena]MDC0709890.1 methyl-accepting chemotaxis protein [Stigmatella ashevillena]